MEIIGLIAEYNPFHKGHLYHINKIKELYPNSLIIAVISTTFTQRGEISILNKWDKTTIALENNIDLVIELPFIYATQSADTFAHAALHILNELKVEKIIFGSECNDINKLKEIANIQIKNKKFDQYVKDYLSKGNNYPTSLSLALKRLDIPKIDSPNDLLGISYIKEIIKNNYNIEPITIKRTNNYHGNNKEILSASEIRKMILDKISVKEHIPYNENILYKNTNYFHLLKYKILTDSDNLNKYQTVDEGIESRIKKYINDSNDLNTLTNKIKTKRYTYNKINRMLIHILTSLTKQEAKLKIDYIKILGFNKKGQKYLNKIKKNTTIPLITNYKLESPLLKKEYIVAKIYSLIVQDDSLIKKELQGPIRK